jgi:hypothetical protein
LQAFFFRIKCYQAFLRYIPDFSTVYWFVAVVIVIRYMYGGKAVSSDISRQ